MGLGTPLGSGIFYESFTYTSLIKFLYVSEVLLLSCSVFDPLLQTFSV